MTASRQYELYFGAIALIAVIFYVVATLRHRYIMTDKYYIDKELPLHGVAKGSRHMCDCGLIFANHFETMVHLRARRLGFGTRCRCGHPRERHQGFSGPNSINQWSHGECTFGSHEYPPYRTGGCGCAGFRLSGFYDMLDSDARNT